MFRNTFKVIINYDVNNVLKNNIITSVKDITVTYKNKLLIDQYTDYLNYNETKSILNEINENY